MSERMVRVTPALADGAVTGRSQEGMAVVSALLIVAFVTVIAASLTQRQITLLRAVQAEQTRGQASGLLRGGVDWAKSVLQADAQRNPVTRLDAGWAEPLLNSRFGSENPLLTGSFSGRIQDEQAKFNLRNFVRQGRVSADDVEMFGRLCAQQGIDARLAGRIVERVVLAQSRSESSGDAEQDELDTLTESELGARGSAAMLTVPETPQAPMVRVLEDLLPLEGMSPSAIARLRPYVTVLPANTALNVNTASAAVLAAAVPGLRIEQANLLVAERNAGRWFVHRADLANRLQKWGVKISRVRMTVVSQWFHLSSVATLNQTAVPMQALIQRQRGGRALPKVVWLREGA